MFNAGDIASQYQSQQVIDENYKSANSFGSYKARREQQKVVKFMIFNENYLQTKDVKAQPRKQKRIRIGNISKVIEVSNEEESLTGSVRRKKSSNGRL